MLLPVRVKFFLVILISVAFLAQEEVDCYSPEYLQGNAQGREPRTFGLLQEKTDSLVFGWNQFVEQGIEYLVLEREVNWALDDTVTVLSGDTAEINVIGQSCKPEKYNIIAKTSISIIYYARAKRSLTYIRVPRITNVHLPLYTDASPYLTWKTDESFCSENDVIVIFRGYSDQPLELHFIPNTDKNFYLENQGNSEGITEEVIISTLHGERFSLPKLVTRGGESNAESHSHDRGNQAKHDYQEDEEEIIIERPVVSRKEDGLGDRTVDTTKKMASAVETATQAPVDTAKKMALAVETTTQPPVAMAKVATVGIPKQFPQTTNIEKEEVQSASTGIIVAIVVVSVSMIFAILYFSYRRCCKQKSVK
ncbi:unnamed protein product [Trichobilharzia szidati]|nr:unnamed protein product [Trichobilharzia szidati]